MRILYLDWKSAANNFMIDAFKNKGYEIVSFDFCAYKDDKVNPEGSSLLVQKLLSETFDYCFSFNYFPVAAVACKACKIKYVSWTFDSPYVFLYSDTIKYETNYAFVFDSSEVMNLKALGIDTVYYLPLASACSYYDSVIADNSIKRKYSCDVSMVGSMYSEPKHRIFDKFDRISQYTKGYLEALIEAQHYIYGADIIEPALTPDIIKELQNDAPFLKPEDELQSFAWLYSKYFFARELTRRERHLFLSKLSEKYHVNLYTYLPTDDLPLVHNMGPVDYYREAPLAFKTAKININIGLRSIINGIPLRCFDILGCGGFLLTDYHYDFEGLLEDGVDYVSFSDTADMMDKVEYYLTHENERYEISRNGYEKVRHNHSFESRIEMIESIITG